MSPGGKVSGKLMNGQLILDRQLSPETIDKLRELSKTCEASDNFRTKIYWNIIKNRQTEFENDITYSVNDQLVGYLGIFHFVEDEVEFCGMVHPDYRQQGIFKILFEEAYKKAPDYEIKRVAVPCSQKATIAKKIMEKMGAKVNGSEYNMQLEKTDLYRKKYHRNIKLRLGKKEDIPTIAAMDAICFETEFEDMLQRYLNDVASEDRRIWIVSKSGKTIGKIHVRFDKNKAYIHDFCVLPNYQGKKYGTDILNKIIDYLLDKYKLTICLDVKAENASAIKIYERAGFVVDQAYEYWKMKL